MKVFRFKLFIFALVLILIFSVSLSVARVGGGQSYGGGSSSSSGGSYGGGGGGDGSGALVYLVIRLLIWLIIECPVIGIPLTIIIIVVFVASSKQKKSNISRHHSTSYSNYGSQAYKPPYQPYGTKSRNFRSFATISDQIKRYKQKDANFSRPLFMDFVQLLYVKVQQTRGDKNWIMLAPYLTQNILNRFQTEPTQPEKVEDVTIGSSNIKQIGTSDKVFDRIIVEFESNCKETKGSKPTVYYIKERWIFQRKKNVLSKGPEDILALHCPSCGSPVEVGPDGKCPHCDNIVNKGDFHWQVFNVVPLERYVRPPLKLGGGSVERGTDVPDVIQANFGAEKRAFQMRYPDFSGPKFEEKVKNTFMKLQNAWSENNWEAVRSLESDPLFASHRYWIERYKVQGLRNCLEDIKILSIRPVKIEQDAYYESITVRIKASMKDYTVDRQGKIVEGNKNKARTFSEYWTFIRRAGFADDKKEKKPDSCPNCGGPIQVSMAGICEYCGGKITSGQFDWILSSIEQDEAYEG